MDTPKSNLKSSRNSKGDASLKKQQQQAPSSEGCKPAAAQSVKSVPVINKTKNSLNPVPKKIRAPAVEPSLSNISVHGSQSLQPQFVQHRPHDFIQHRVHSTHHRRHYANKSSDHNANGGQAKCHQGHSFHTDVTDVQQMEQGLLQLLEDFHDGKLQAFGQDITFEKMESVREQQERLARLHFELNTQQEIYGHDSEEGRSLAKENMSKLMDNLQQLSNSIEQLQLKFSVLGTENATANKKRDKNFY